MNPQRKKIIISEIKYWKQSNLLPAHYCDFLIALYAQGEQDENVEGKVQKSELLKERNKLTNKLVMLLLLSVIFCGSMFIFSAYPILTISLAAGFILFLLIYAMHGSMVKSKIIPFIYISSALIILAISLKLWIVFFEGQTMLLLGLIVLNCALWLFTGRLLKLLYFTISGAVGIILVIVFLFLK